MQDACRGHCEWGSRDGDGHMGLIPHQQGKRAPAGWLANGFLFLMDGLKGWCCPSGAPWGRRAGDLVRYQLPRLRQAGGRPPVSPGQPRAQLGERGGAVSLTRHPMFCVSLDTKDGFSGDLDLWVGMITRVLPPGQPSGARQVAKSP